MSRPIKILLAVVAVLVVLLLGIAVAAMLLFDPNEYRGEIAAFVEERTGREFSIDGDLGLRVLPCCAVAVDDTRLGNPPGFTEPDFASVRSVRLGLQLFPLLFERRVVVDEVTLDGLDLRLLRRADGATNWEFAPDAAAEGEPEPPAEAPSEGAPLPELSVAGVDVRDAMIEFRDETAGTHFVVEDLDISSGAVVVGKPVDIDVTLRARDVPTGSSIDAKFTAGLLVAADGQRAELRGIDSSARIGSPDLPAAGATVDLKGQSIDADLESGAVRLEGIAATLAAAGVRLDGTLSGSAQGDNAALSGTLSVPAFSPRAALAELGEPPIETADPDVLKSLELSADWSATAQRLDVTSLKARLDDTRITGRLQTGLDDAAGTTFDVEVDAIDLDRYAAPEPEATGGSGGEAAEEAELPSESLRDLNVEGRAAIGRLTLGGLKLQNVVAKLTAKNGVVSIDPSSADVYGGRYNGTLRLDVRGEQPRLSLTQTLDSVQIGGILGDLYEAENLQGLAQARFEGSGSGRTTTELLRGMAGSVALDLDEAVYKGADVWYEIRKSVARVKGKPAPPAPADPQTQITALGFAGQLADGKLRSDRLAGEIPFIRVEGGGVFDLLQNQLDYRLRARMLSRPNFPEADDLADLERIAIPITVRGDAADPKIGIDLEELAKDAAVQKAKDRLIDKLGLGEPEQTGDAESNATDQQPKSERDQARDVLKKGLRDLLD